MNELKKLAELRAHGQMVCSAKDVLALFAENEKLKFDLREVKDAKLGLSWAIGEIMGERDQLRAENDRLEGLRPESPPRPPDGDGLPRYGLRWNGPQQPLAVPMVDGYWTPWHLAEQLKSERDNLREDRDGLLDAGAHLL